MKIFISLLLVFCCLTGCAATRPSAQEQAKESALTAGMAKEFIYPGKTSQAQVMEIFGPPDLVTRKDGKDLWTYDKISQEVTSSSGYLTIILAGVESSRASRRNKSVMLIVYFDENDVVVDYKLSVAKF